jgi:hypothetical protein
VYHGQITPAIRTDERCSQHRTELNRTDALGAADALRTHQDGVGPVGREDLRQHPAQGWLGQGAGAHVNEDIAPPRLGVVTVSGVPMDIAQQVPNIAHVWTSRIGPIQLGDRRDQLEHARRKPELIRRLRRTAILAQHRRESCAHPAPGRRADAVRQDVLVG